MAIQIDETDIQITEMLSQDGRMSSAEIARRIGNVTKRVVSYRIERLCKLGVIQVCAVPIPQRLGFPVNADVFIEVEPGMAVAIARNIADYENVTYVACSMGTNDISVQVVAVDNTELFAFVTQTIGRIHGVRKTATTVVPLVVKDVYHWRIPASVIQPPNTSESKNPNKLKGKA